MKAGSISSKKILITGSNKGLGYCILKALAKRNEKHSFVMAVRDLNRGSESLKELVKEIPDIEARIELLELDISNTFSIMKAIQTLEIKGIKIDCLINNAAIADNNVYNLSEESVKRQLMTNFYGTVEFTGSISHLINENGKIIFIGSLAGSLDALTSENLIKKFEDPNLSMYKLFLLSQKYYLEIKYNRAIKEGWSKWPYGETKRFVNFYAKLLSADPVYVKRNIQIYCEHPGTFKTDMTISIPSIMKLPFMTTVEEAIKGTCFLFDLPWTINEYQGCYFDQCEKASLRQKVDFSQMFIEEEKAFKNSNYS